MLEYFKKQLETVPPLDDEGAAAMIATRIENGHDEATITEYLKSKIGQRLVFFIKSTSDRLEVQKCFEDEIDETLKDATFVEMIGADGGVPKFAF